MLRLGFDRATDVREIVEAAVWELSVMEDWADCVEAALDAVLFPPEGAPATAAEAVEAVDAVDAVEHSVFLFRLAMLSRRNLL